MIDVFKDMNQAQREAFALKEQAIDRDIAREQFSKAGHLAFGKRWQAPMAEFLSEVFQRKISVAQVNHWHTGVRPVPVEIDRRMRGLCLFQAQILRRRADDLHEVYRPIYSERELRELHDKKELLAQLQAYIAEHE